MICPKCNNKARESWGYPGTYVCDCTGVLEDISNFKKNTTLNFQVSKNRDRHEDEQAKSRAHRSPYHHSTVKLLYPGPPNISSKTKGTTSGSLYLDEILEVKIPSGKITTLLTSNNTTKYSEIIFALNFAKANPNTLIIDSTGDASRLNKNYSFNLNNIEQPTTLEEAYGSIFCNKDKFDNIILLNSNSLAEADAVQNGVSEPTKRSHLHHQYLLALNILAKQNNLTLIYHTQTVEGRMPMSYQEISSDFKILNSISPIHIRANHVSGSLDIRIKKNSYVTKLENRPIHLYIEKDIHYNKPKDIIHCARYKKILRYGGYGKIINNTNKDLVFKNESLNVGKSIHTRKLEDILQDEDDFNKFKDYIYS